MCIAYPIYYYDILLRKLDMSWASDIIFSFKDVYGLSI